jgi:hypothetical protein
LQNDWVEGRVQPVPFSLERSVMSRSAIDASPLEKNLLLAAGLFETINGGVSAVYAPVQDPLIQATFKGITLRRLLGAGVGASQTGGATESEESFGGLVQTLAFSGGDQEVRMKVGGVAQGKRWGGRIDSITLASGVVTTVTITAEESYRLSVGAYFICELEVIQVTAVVPGSTSATIARAQLGTTGVAHTGVPLLPYLPGTTPLTGRPISEANTAGTLDAINLRATKWDVSLTTGMAPLPGEIGSKRFQGVKNTRYDVKVSLNTVLHREEVSLLGKAAGRKLMALSLTQGAAVGGRFNFAAPYCELDPIRVPDTMNDVAMVTLNLRVRDSVGTDAFSITYT